MERREWRQQKARRDKGIEAEQKSRERRFLDLSFMKLPDKCPHCRSAKNWLRGSVGFSQRGHAPGCCRNDYDFRVVPPEEPPLCRDLKIVSEEYRFIWHSSFDGDVCVRLGRNSKNVTLRWNCSSFTYGLGRFQTCVDMLGWAQLEAALLVAKFWVLDQTDETICGFDGATWIIEGRRRDVYRVMSRWSPTGPIFDLGRTFCELAGPPIADFRLY
jgi:hypothetical protein